MKWRNPSCGVAFDRLTSFQISLSVAGGVYASEPCLATEDLIVDGSEKLLKMDSGVKRRNRKIRERELGVNIRDAAMATHDSCLGPFHGNSANHSCDTPGCGLVEIEPLTDVPR